MVKEIYIAQVQRKDIGIEITVIVKGEEVKRIATEEDMYLSCWQLNGQTMKQRREKALEGQEDKVTDVSIGCHRAHHGYSLCDKCPGLAVMQGL